MGISHLTNKRLKNVKQSANSDHLLTCNCNINFDGFTILSNDSNNINLLIKESLLISRDKPILNKTVKSFPLELFKLQNLIIVWRFDCLFNKNVCNILNVTVKTMPWWNVFVVILLLLFFLIDSYITNQQVIFVFSYIMVFV